jgi:thioredoxin-dependent peroxiredoxin
VGNRKVEGVVPLVDEGKKAPAFSLKDQEGKTHSLKDYAGRPLVLYFYPKDDTPGCTTEACNFRDALPDFSKIKATILGVSVLDSSSKAQFAAKHELNFPLLADEDHAVADKYGAWQEKSMYGRKYMGIARITYLIDGDGKVARRWDKVSVGTHADEVLEAVKGL